MRLHLGNYNGEAQILIMAEDIEASEDVRYCISFIISFLKCFTRNGVLA